MTLLCAVIIFKSKILQGEEEGKEEELVVVVVAVLLVVVVVMVVVVVVVMIVIVVKIRMIGICNASTHYSQKTQITHIT
jgi:hypothetical protein